MPGVLGDEYEEQDYGKVRAECDAASTPPPPGCAGLLHEFMMRTSYLPVSQVSTSAVLAWASGVCGGAYLTNTGTGLNVYGILAIESGRGKETLVDGPKTLNDLLFKGPDNQGAEGAAVIPFAWDFHCYDDFASPQALAKYLAKHPVGSVCNIIGEIGHTIREMAMCTDSRGSELTRGKRKLWTNLFMKSGRTRGTAGGIRYADEKNNVTTTGQTSFSIFGDTTPGTYYESLTESMMADGFLSRFLAIEYLGPRPPKNPKIEVRLDAELVAHLRQLIAHAVDLHNRHERQVVAVDPDAQFMLDDFEKRCEAGVNKSKSAAEAQMYNRAHIKLLRLSSLLAVIDNYVNPVVTEAPLVWAMELIRRDVVLFTERLQNGDIGNSDHTRQRKLTSIIADFIDKPLPPSYGIPQIMQRDGVVPRKYLQLRTAQVTLFNGHKNGHLFALDSTIRSMVDSGYLVEMDKAKAGEEYTFQGKCYRVVNVPME